MIWLTKRMPASRASARRRSDHACHLGSSSMTSRITFVSTSVSVIPAQKFHDFIGGQSAIGSGSPADCCDQLLATRRARPRPLSGTPQGDHLAIDVDFDFGARLDPHLIAQAFGYRNLALAADPHR